MEGKLQVELAQLSYLLPRLIGQWKHLERLGGGIGTRGPGETQLESDRRMIRHRIEKITRASSGACACIVGSSATGARRPGCPWSPSSATPTPARRRCSTASPARSAPPPTGSSSLSIRRPGSSRARPTRPFILTDTVGFIRKLPHQLVAAFKATLEELEEADVLLHVVDASHPALEEQMAAVESLLGELELGRATNGGRPQQGGPPRAGRGPRRPRGALRRRGRLRPHGGGDGRPRSTASSGRFGPAWSALPCGFPTVTARPSPSATSAAGCCRGPTTWTASCSRSSCPRASWVLWSPTGRPAEPHHLSRRALSRGMIRLGLVRNG